MAIVDIESVRNRRFEEMQEEIDELRAKAEMSRFWQEAALKFGRVCRIVSALRRIESSFWSRVPLTDQWFYRRDARRDLDEELRRL